MNTVGETKDFSNILQQLKRNDLKKKKNEICKVPNDY